VVFDSILPNVENVLNTSFSRRGEASLVVMLAERHTHSSLRASMGWGIPNSYLIRHIINTHLKRHRLGVD
jgi:hypothetical protein